MSSRALGILATVVLLLGSAESVTAEVPLEVVVSIPPQEWLVKQIGDESVEIEVLVAPGESPATYSPTDAQVTRLMTSQIYFRIGVPFEKGLWFDAVRQMGRFTMVDLREGIETRGGDPHIWLAPELLAIQAHTVAEALAQHDPNRRAFYEGRLDLFRSRMEALDQQIEGNLASFKGRPFFVFHPSWGYFAEAYGLRQVAIEIDGREPSDKQLTRLQAEAREYDITTIFVQPQIHDRSARAFAESIGGGLEILDPLAADVAANLELTAGLLSASFRATELP